MGSGGGLDGEEDGDGSGGSGMGGCGGMAPPNGGKRGGGGGPRKKNKLGPGGVGPPGVTMGRWWRGWSMWWCGGGPVGGRGGCCCLIIVVVGAVEMRDKSQTGCDLVCFSRDDEGRVDATTNSVNEEARPHWPPRGPRRSTRQTSATSQSVVCTYMHIGGAAAALRGRDLPPELAIEFTPEKTITARR